MFILRLQEGREQYDLAATSEQVSKKKAKGKKKEKDMDELKKEVDMVSVSAPHWAFCTLLVVLRCSSSDCLLLPISLPRPLYSVGFIPSASPPFKYLFLPPVFHRKTLTFFFFFFHLAFSFPPHLISRLSFLDVLLTCNLPLLFLLIISLLSSSSSPLLSLLPLTSPCLLLAPHSLTSDCFCRSATL